MASSHVVEKAFKRGEALGMIKCGKTIKDVAQELGLTRQTIRRWRRMKFPVRDKPRSGRPRRTRRRIDQAIVRKATNDPTLSVSEIGATTCPTVSRSTVWRRLKENGFISRKRPTTIDLTERHKKNRLDWAMRHCHWRDLQWKKVVWSDEASVRLRGKDGRLRIWITSGQKIPEDLKQPVRQGGGGWLLVWGAIWIGGRSDLVILKETMNSERYLRILEKQIYPISFQLGNPSTDWIYMDDNAPPHRSSMVKEFKKNTDLRTIDWPAMSPDLNPIENVWSILKRNIRKKMKPNDNMEKLELLLRKEWNDLKQSTIDNLIICMPTRIRMVIENCGSTTKY